MESLKNDPNNIFNEFLAKVQRKAIQWRNGPGTFGHSYTHTQKFVPNTYYHIYVYINTHTQTYT